MNDLQRRQVEETQYREDRSKASWAMMHAEAEAGRVTAFHIDDMKHQRLHSLKEQVTDWAIGWSRAAENIRISRLVRWLAVASGGAPFTRARRSHMSAPPLLFQVADLCDMQPTPANMLRPARKVRALRPWPDPALVPPHQ